MTAIEHDERTPASSVWAGVVTGLYACEYAGEEMHALDAARLLAGQGVEGDRYCTGWGHYSHRPHPDRQITIIESETLEALARDHGIELRPEETRRNVVTRGVPLNHLVGRRFRLGEAVLYGGRLNVPCRYLEELIDKPVFDPLVHRSGLNCQILVGGTVRPGDSVLPL